MSIIKIIFLKWRRLCCKFEQNSIYNELFKCKFEIFKI